MIELDLPLYKNLANPANYWKKRGLSGIKWIVLHYTGNDGDTDTGNGKYFAREAVGASAHYFVDEDSATQSVPDEYIAWHCQTPGMALKCGCRNSNSIGVEMCSDYVNGKCVITEKTKQNAAKIVKWLMAKYHIPPERVVRHFDVCGKECPLPWVKNKNEWLGFKKILGSDAAAVMTEEVNEMVQTINITVNGKEIKADAIIKDGITYIKLRGLEAAGFKVDCINETKMRVLDNETKDLPIVVNGKQTNVEAVNLHGYNYVQVRSLAEVLGIKVGFEDGKVLLDKE